MSESDTPVVADASALEEAAATVAEVPASEDPAGAIHPPVESAPTEPAPPIAVGDHVMYCLAEGTRIGEWRPAFVVQKFGEGDLVNLQVLTDGSNDYLVCPLWVTSRHFGSGPGCWRLRQVS